jgi:hypothetical protein
LSDKYEWFIFVLTVKKPCFTVKKPRETKVIVKLQLKLQLVKKPAKNALTWVESLKNWSFFRLKKFIKMYILAGKSTFREQ